MSSLKWSWLGLLTVLLTSCGDPQVDTQYRGIPIWTLDGVVAVAGPPPAAQPRMALFWSPQGIDVVDPDQWVEQVGTATPVQLPSSFTFNVFEPPGPEHMLRLPDGSSAGYAVGRLVIYEDADDNGHHTPGEPFIGINGHSGYYYFAESLPAKATPTSTPLPPGFYSAFLPQPCSLMMRPPTDPATCGVPIGSPCREDAECTAGLCVFDTSLPWPNGYCTIPVPSPTGCYPTAAVFAGRPMYGMFSSEIVAGLYLKPCAMSSDCIRAPEAMDDYLCDPGLRACVPNDRNLVSVQTGVPILVEPFCAGPH